MRTTEPEFAVDFETRFSDGYPMLLVTQVRSAYSPAFHASQAISTAVEAAWLWCSRTLADSICTKQTELAGGSPAGAPASWIEHAAEFAVTTNPVRAFKDSPGSNWFFIFWL